MADDPHSPQLATRSLIPAHAARPELFAGPLFHALKGDYMSIYDKLVGATAEGELPPAVLDGISTQITDGTSIGEALDARYRVGASVEVSIPTDFPTLQAAIDHFSRRGIEVGEQVTLHIESGHQPARGVRVEDGDFSRFLITSADPVVQVADNFAGEFLRAQRAIAPTLACLVDQRDRGGEGVFLWQQAQGIVLAGCGVRNAEARGLYVGDASTCFAQGSIFTGSGNRNAWITRASTLSAEHADFSANKGGTNAVYVSRASRAVIEHATITDAFQNALVSTRSWVTATEVDVSRAGRSGLLSERGGHIQAERAVVDACTSFGVYAIGGVVIARGATITGNTRNGIHAVYSANVDAMGATVTGNTAGDVHIDSGSFVNLGESSTTSGSPAVSDTNVSAFNAVTRSGVIWS